MGQRERKERDGGGGMRTETRHRSRKDRFHDFCERRCDFDEGSRSKANPAGTNKQTRRVFHTEMLDFCLALCM